MTPSLFFLFVARNKKNQVWTQYADTGKQVKGGQGSKPGSVQKQGKLKADMEHDTLASTEGSI